MAQTVKITPATGLLEFIGDNVANKPVLQHDNAGNLTLTLQSAKKFTVGGNLKVNGKVTMAQQTLVDGAAITWDFNSGANAKVTIAGARTLVIANMETGDTGLILVKQDAVGGRTLTLPNGSSIVGGGSYTASTAANATDVLGVYYDGSTYWWTIGYNTVTPPLTSVGITGSDFTISNSPLTSNGNIGLALATVNSNVGQFGSASAVPVITVNAKGLITAVSTTAISIPTDLNSLTDVTLSSSASGQLLQFNGSQWVNWTPNYLTGITSAQVTTALGYTPVTNARTITINGVTYDLTTNRTWTIDTVSYTSRIQHGVKAGVAINKGQAVYVTSGDGTNMIVGLASNASEATSSKTMGLLDATVAINGMANVITEGLLAGLDTSLAGAEGDPVWLGTNGNLIFGLANKPYAPNHLVFIGIVTRKQQNNGEIFVKVQNGFELKEIHDVDLTTTVPVNGEILGYNGTLWVNKTIAGWLGFTPANDANVVHTTGNETIAGIKTFSGTTQATSTTTGTIVTAGGVGIAKNLYVGGDINVVGNLVIGGTTTTIYAQNLSVSDNMIYLNNGVLTTITNAVGNGTSVVYTTQETHNYVTGMSVTITGVSPTAYNLSNQTITAVSANSFTIANSATGTYSSGGSARAKTNANPDLGFAAGYNDGSYAHAGLFRDATDNTWKFFKGYVPEPDASPFIDTSHASFALADLQAYNITANTFVKSGGTSSQFLKADGSVDSNTYLTTGTASSTYQPLDADLTAIAALATTGFLKRTGTNTWSLDSNTYLTSYTETDTLATVTGRGATTSTAVTFSGGATISTLALNGATTSAEASLFLGAHSTTEGGQLVLQKGTSSTYATHLDNFTDAFRILYGTNTGSAGVALTLSMSTRQLTLPAYTTSSSFSGTAAGWLAFDASGNIITVAAPTGAVTSVNAGTGVSVNSTTGAVTVSIGQSVATLASPTFSQVLTTNNGSGTNVKIGDDVWIGDVNNANTLGIVGQQDATAGYITFGSELSNKLGRTGTGDLTWGGNRIWHAGNLTNLNQLTNGPGYLTSAIISATAGSGISVSTSAGNLNIVNTGLLSATAGSGITVSTASGNLNIVNSGLLSATAGSGITVSTSLGNLNIVNSGLLSATAGSGITVSTSGGNLNIVNSGILAATAGTGISVSTSSGTLNIVNTITNTNQLTNGAGFITTNDRAYPRRSDGTNIDFTYSAQSGQPTYLWGTNNGTTMYVYNPSNFSVAYASEAKWISFDDGPRDLSDRRPNWNNRSVAWDFVTAGTAAGVGNYAGVMTFSPWDGTAASTGDSSYQLAFINETGINASGIPGLRLRNGIDSTWNNWYQVWHSGNFTNNSSNWNTAYSKRPTALAFSGTGTKTLTLTLGDSTTLTASFSDIDTNTDAQTLSLSGSTLTISGGNSITLPASGISQAAADLRYVDVSGDLMSGNLYIYPSGNQAQLQLVGTNPELYVSAASGTSRVFINRAASGNQATLMFTTGMNVVQGVAWDYTGVPMWTLGMTNNNNTDSFKIAYGDIYDPNSVALEITSANVAYFRSVPYGGGSLLATQSWVTSQGYITGVTNISGYSNNLISQDIRTLSPSSHSAYRLNFGFTSWSNNNTSPWADYLHLRSYSDASGGLDNLVMFKKTGGIGMRIWQQTWGSATAYSSYVDVIHSSNIGSYAWTSSNDGAGSGLDADLLDGYNTSAAGTANTIALRDSSGNLYGNYILGTYFNASQGNSENPTIGQIWTQNTSDNYLRKSTPAHFRSQVTDSYYIKLDTNTTTSGRLTLTYNDISEPYSPLELRGGGTHTGLYINPQAGAQAHVRFAADGTLKWQIRAPFQDGIDTSLKIYSWNTANDVFVFDHDGTLTVSNRLIELSSIRYKTNIESLTPALDKVLQLRPVYYTKIGGTGETEIGLIAEEVAEIYPELIKYNEAGQVDGINYTRIAPILIKTIQEQQELIKNLTKRIDDLENR